MPAAVATLPGDEGDMGVQTLDAGNGLEDILAVAVGTIQRQDIDLGFHQGSGALLHIVTDADGAGDQQAVLAVAGGIGVLLGLFDIP